MQNDNLKLKIILLFSVVFFGSLLLAKSSLAAILEVGAGKTYSTIQACANAAVAGDTCLVSAGTYNETVTLPRSGTSDNPITFLAAPGPKPRITGGFQITSRNYITIQGFVLNDWIRCSPFSGTPCNWIKILNNDIENTGIGIQLRANDVLISGNTFNNLSGDMVRQHGDRWTVRNNTVINEVDSNDVHMDFWQSFCAGDVSASYALIENNEYIDISGGNAHFALANATSSCGDPITNVIFRYNKVRNIGSMAIYIDDNQAASGNRDNSIYNNTFMDLDGGSPSPRYCCPLSASESSSGLNNIFYNAVNSSGATGFIFASGGFSDYNLYFDPDTTMTFGSPASGETHAVKNQNPLLTDPNNNDFSLRPGSPAIDKGGPLTRVAGPDSGSGTSLIVNEAKFFQPGWGGANPDTIAVGSAGNVAQIVSIDYTSNTITLPSSISRSDGDSVYLFRDSDGTQVLYGSAPDIGAVEYVTPGSDTTPPSPPRNLRIQ